MSCIWSRSTCAIPVFSWQETSSPVYVRNMELREKYGMCGSQTVKSLCTSKHFIYPEFPNKRMTLSDSLYILQETIFNLWYRFLFLLMQNESEKYIVFIEHFHLVYGGNMKKKRFIMLLKNEESKLLFMFIKLAKTSIHDRLLLILSKKFYKGRSIKNAIHAIIRDITIPLQMCNVLDSHTTSQVE